MCYSPAVKIANALHTTANQSHDRGRRFDADDWVYCILERWIYSCLFQGKFCLSRQHRQAVWNIKGSYRKYNFATAVKRSHAIASLLLIFLYSCMFITIIILLFWEQALDQKKKTKLHDDCQSPEGFGRQHRRRMADDRRRWSAELQSTSVETRKLSPRVQSSQCDCFNYCYYYHYYL